MLRGIDLGIELSKLAGQLPVLLVWMGAAGLCLIRAERDPRRARLVGIALAIFLVTTIVFPFLKPSILNAGGGGFDDVHVRNLIDQAVDSVPHSIAFAMLLWTALQPARRPPGGLTRAGDPPAAEDVPDLQ